MIGKSEKEKLGQKNEKYEDRQARRVDGNFDAHWSNVRLNLKLILGLLALNISGMK